MLSAVNAAARAIWVVASIEFGSAKADFDGANPSPNAELANTTLAQSKTAQRKA
jgi:hypothetical protein